MSFLFPAMLAGLLGLAVPTVLHLIARQRFPSQDLPTTRFLDVQRRTNVLAMRLVDPVQLLLRLALIALAVLAMARLFSAGGGGVAAPRSVVLVIDTSASMRAAVVARREESGGAKEQVVESAVRNAREIVASLPAGSRCGLIADGASGPNDVALTMDLSLVRERLGELTALDGGGRSLLRQTAEALKMLHGRHESNCQVIVLSDMRRSAFGERDAALSEMIRDATQSKGDPRIVCVDLLGDNVSNLGITNAEIRGGEARVGEDAHLLATLQNFGSESAEAKVHMSVGGRRDPASRAVTLPAGGRAVVDMTTRASRATQTITEVSLDVTDGYAADDAWTSPLNIADSRRVLLVSAGESATPTADRAGREQLAQLAGGADASGASAPGGTTIDGATILRFALNPGREAGQSFGTGIDVTTVTPEAIASQPLSKYEVIFLYDVASLSEQAISDLRTFVSEGRALVFIASAGMNAATFNRVFASAGKDSAPLSPAVLGNDRSLESPVGFRSVADADPLLAPFRDPTQGDVSVIRFLALRDVTSRGEASRMLLEGTGGVPLAIEQTYGRGKVVLLTFGLELNRGNLARTRVFPALIWRMVDYLCGRLGARQADILEAMRPAVLDVSEVAFSLTSELELSRAEATTSETQPAATRPADSAPRSYRLQVSDARTVLVPGLPSGRYLLHKARSADESGPILGYSRYVTVHTSSAESDTSRVSEPMLRSTLGPSASLIGLDSIGSVSQSRGGEFTLWLVVAGFLIYVIEAIAGWWSGRRRSNDTAGGPA